MCWVGFVLYVDVWSVAMKSSVRFYIYIYIYEHIWNCVFAAFLFYSEISFPEMTGMQSLSIFVFELLLQSWDLSHRVERHKLMVMYDPKAAFTYRGQVDDKISAPMSYFTYWNNYIKVERLIKITYYKIDMRYLCKYIYTYIYIYMYIYIYTMYRMLIQDARTILVRHDGMLGDAARSVAPHRCRTVSSKCLV